MNYKLLWRRFLYGWDQTVPCTVLSRHKTHNVLGSLEFPFSCVVNMGYGAFPEVDLPDHTFTLVNPPEGCRRAADKLLMKHCFLLSGVPTAPFYAEPAEVPESAYPIVAKHRMGSRGTGVYLLNSKRELTDMQTCRGMEFFHNTFILEKCLKYTHEFRIHATQHEAFYANRKALKHSTPDWRRWKYTYEDSVWLREDHEGFHKPLNWGEIVEASVGAVRAVGLDVGGVDVKVEPSADGSPAKFFIIEVNSAPSFGDLTASKYREIMPCLVRRIRESRPDYNNF